MVINIKSALIYISMLDMLNILVFLITIRFVSRTKAVGLEPVPIPNSPYIAKPRVRSDDALSVPIPNSPSIAKPRVSSYELPVPIPNSPSIAKPRVSSNELVCSDIFGDCSYPYISHLINLLHRTLKLISEGVSSKGLSFLD